MINTQLIQLAANGSLSKEIYIHTSQLQFCFVLFFAFSISVPALFSVPVDATPGDNTQVNEREQQCVL